MSLLMTRAQSSAERELSTWHRCGGSVGCAVATRVETRPPPIPLPHSPSVRRMLPPTRPGHIIYSQWFLRQSLHVVHCCCQTCTSLCSCHRTDRSFQPVTLFSASHLHHGLFSVTAENTKTWWRRLRQSQSQWKRARSARERCLVAETLVKFVPLALCVWPLLSLSPDPGVRADLRRAQDKCEVVHQPIRGLLTSSDVVQQMKVVEASRDSHTSRRC